MFKGPEIKAFLIHLRLHYQFLILSGAYLCGVVMSGGPAGGRNFLVQFFNVHVFLFGGVTAYNSFWDRDDGPIGGLRAPPPMAEWTLWASWVLQFIGLAVSAFVSFGSAAVYFIAMIFFWLYSRPGVRWKGRPILSLIAIGISTGACGFLLGFMHSGQSVNARALAGALGVSLLIVSLFPLSQVYQVAEDAQRNDITFTVRYGLAGVKRAFAVLFFAGVLILSAAFTAVDARLGVVFLLLGASAGTGVGYVLRNLQMSPGEYARVMGIKYAASGLFSAFLVLVLGLQASHRLHG